MISGFRSTMASLLLDRLCCLPVTPQKRLCWTVLCDAAEIYMQFHKRTSIMAMSRGGVNPVEYKKARRAPTTAQKTQRHISSLPLQPTPSYEASGPLGTRCRRMANSKLQALHRTNRPDRKSIRFHYCRRYAFAPFEHMTGFH